MAYPKSQTGDTGKKVYINNPVNYRLQMYKYQDWLVVASNDSTYQKHGGGTVDFDVRPDTLFGIPQPFNSYGNGTFFHNAGDYLISKIYFRFKCSKISNYHSQSSWKVYPTTTDFLDTLKVFVFTDISGAMQTAKDVMNCN